MPDRRGYNLDGCSAESLVKLAKSAQAECISPALRYQLLVLPNVETMTPELVRKLGSLVKAGATLVGNPPRKSPSLVDYPACDDEVARRAEAIWGRLQPPIEQANRGHGKGRVVWGQALYAADADEPSPILQARWIWEAQGNPASAAPVGSVTLRRQFHLPLSKRIHSARLEMTAENGFMARSTANSVLEGSDFNRYMPRM